jgi:hypothetical protein
VAHAKLHVVTLDRPATAGASDDAARASGSAAAPFASLPGGSARDHDYAAVLAALRYMDDPAAIAATARADRSARAGKYITFCTDCGGFNNIRMGFEHAVLMAWMTRRTLVLPPPRSWYLIDFGPFAFKRPGDAAMPVSRYADFFDVEILSRDLPGGVIAAADFVAKEGARFGPLPPTVAKLFEAGGSARYGRGGKESPAEREWHAWLNAKFASVVAATTRSAIFDPSIAAFEASGARFAASKRFVRSKQKFEFLSGHAGDIGDRDVLHFPGCNKVGGVEGRTLGQIASTVYFADARRERHFKDFWRSSVVFSRDVFECAARVVATLGLHRFSALHIRRNDLQYKTSYQNAA